MYTYDFIVGIKLSQYHNRIIMYDRAELDTTEPSKIYGKLAKMVSDCLEGTLEIPNRDEINRVLSKISESLDSTNVSKDDLDRVDQCFDVIAYLGLEADAFRRDDGVVPVTEQSEVMAFIVNDKIDELDERISSAISIFTNDVHAGSITDVIMETFRSRIRLDATLSDIINLNTQIDNWELMQEVGASGDINVTRLHTLLNDMGFRVKIFVS